MRRLRSGACIDFAKILKSKLTRCGRCRLLSLFNSEAVGRNNSAPHIIAAVLVCAHRDL